MLQDRLNRQAASEQDRWGQSSVYPLGLREAADPVSVDGTEPYLLRTNKLMRHRLNAGITMIQWEDGGWGMSLACDTLWNPNITKSNCLFLNLFINISWNDNKIQS